MARSIPNMNDWRVRRFLEWLCTVADERNPPHQYMLAEELDVSTTTLADWKDDADFQAGWERQFRKTVGSPERMNTVLYRLYQTATDLTDPRQVPAARTYLEIVGKLAPPRPAATSQKRTKELTNDELYTILADRAAQEITR